MIALLGFLLSLLISVAHAAPPACVPGVAPNSPACQAAAVNLQSTDLLLGQQATGPGRANQTVGVSIPQVTAGGFAGAFSTLGATGAATFGSTLGVTGDATFSGAINGPVRQFNGVVQYYVDKTGSDANACTAAGAAACLTIRGALGKFIGTRDFGGNPIYVNVAAGTYDESVTVTGEAPGSLNLINADGAPIVIQGAGSATTSIAPNAHCTPGTGDAVFASGGAAVVVKGLTLTTACSGRSDIFVQNYAHVGIGGTDVVIGTAGAGGNGEQIHTEIFGIFEVPGAASYTIAGNAATHWSVTNHGHIALDSATSVNCTGTPAFSRFAWVQHEGYVDASNETYTGCGSVTGIQYVVSTGGIIDLGDLSTIPGNSPGVSYTTGIVFNNGGSINDQGLVPSPTSSFIGSQDGATTVNGTITKAASATWLDIKIFGPGGAGGDGVACGAGASCSGGAAGGGGGRTIVHSKWADLGVTTCAVSISPAHVHGTAGAGSNTAVSCGSSVYRAGGGGDGANGANGAVAGGGGGGGIGGGSPGTTSGGSAGAGGSAGGNGTGGVAVATYAGTGGGGSTATGAGQAGAAANNGESGAGSGAGCNAGAIGTAGGGGASQVSSGAAAGANGISDDNGGTGGGGGAGATGAANAGNGGAAGNPGGGGAGGGDPCDGGTGTVGEGAAGGYGAVFAVQY